MLEIMKAADQRGRLPETILEEFAAHPFFMPALWDCRNYIWSIDLVNYRNKPMLIPHLALISTMAGRLDKAEAYVRLLGETPRHFRPQELTSSLNAMECFAACYDGRQDEVEEWLEKTAPDENRDLFMMDMYAYLIKGEQMNSRPSSWRSHPRWPDIFRKLQVQNRQQAVNRGREIHLL